MKDFFNFLSALFLAGCFTSLHGLGLFHTFLLFSKINKHAARWRLMYGLVFQSLAIVYYALFLQVIPEENGKLWPSIAVAVVSFGYLGFNRLCAGFLLLNPKTKLNMTDPTREKVNIRCLEGTKAGDHLKPGAVWLLICISVGVFTFCFR